MNMNQKASQGLPVGPAASIILAEAVLTDVDRFIVQKGLSHTRYVDDFRVYGDSRNALLDLLREVALYLHTIHRLSPFSA